MRRLFFLTAVILIGLVIIRVWLSIWLAPQIEDGQEVNFTTNILSEPSLSHGLYTFPVSFANNWGSQTIRVTTPEYFSYGQTVTISGRVDIKVLNNKQTIYAIYFPTLVAKASITQIPLAFAQSIRSKVQSIYLRALGTNEASLLLGIVLGVKGSFSQDLLAAFKLTGVMHVIAASGMNVTMLAGFLLAVLGRYLKRQYVAALGIVVLLVYCLLAGLQPSIVRATIMGCMGLLAQLWGRQYSGIYGLFLAACAMLLLSPNLLQDVGFQLSFASSLGILLFHPHVSKIPFLNEDIVITLSAQVATLPILLMTFGQYGILSIVVNALVLWTIAPLMILGGISAIIGLLIQPLGSFIAILSLPLLWYFQTVVLFFGRLKWTLTFSSLPVVLIVGYYGIILAVVWILQLRNSQKESETLT